MTATGPQALPHVEGIRNPRRHAIAAALEAEIRAQGITIKCLSKVVAAVDPSIGYGALLDIVHGRRDPHISDIATICDVLAIRFEDLAATASNTATTGDKK